MRRLLVGIVYAAAGAIAVFVAWRLTDVVPDDAVYWWIWSGFAAVTLLFSLRSAEVDDRVFASSALMVIMAAAMTLSSLPQGDLGSSSVLLPVTLLAAAVFYSPGDFSRGNFSRALSNFGQLAVSGFFAALVVDSVLAVGASSSVVAALSSVSGDRSGDVLAGLLVASVAGIAGSIAYALVNYMAVRLGVLGIYGRQATIPWSQSVTVVRAEMVQGFTGSVLGALLASAPSISLVALMLTVFVIGQLVFTSHATLRKTHESMLKGFVKILETRDLYTRGHTERVVEFCLAIGEELGFAGRQLARIRLAALIHDVGKLAVPMEIMRKQGELTPEEYHQMRVASHKVDDLLSEVEFLDPMVTICSGCHPKWDGEDFGQQRHVHARIPSVEQSVLAVADAFDAMTSTRSYRMAMPQTVALDRLSSSKDPLFDSAVVSALRRALDRKSGIYGPPQMIQMSTQQPGGSING